MTEFCLPTNILEQLCNICAQYPELKAVKLFGSYATGRATSHSDIDLATVGITDRRLVGRLALDLDDLHIPQKCDVLANESINYELLKRHIDNHGIIIYGKLGS